MGNVVYNIDCMDAMAEMRDNEFDFCVTDPPYNVGFQYNTHKDDMENYYDWCLKWLHELMRVVSGVICISCGIVNLGMWHKIKTPNWVACWYKPAAMGRSAVGFCNWEPILIYGKNGKQSVDVVKSVIKPDKKMSFHPCPKPIDWARGIIKNYANEGDKILDIFLGSGTTRIAAHDMGFDFVGYEIDKDYFDAQEKRFQNHIQQTTLFKPNEMY